MALTAYYSFAANGIADGVVAAVANIAESFRNKNEVRKTVRELQSLSNRELADLGLHRSEIRRVAMQAVYKN